MNYKQTGLFISALSLLFAVNVADACKGSSTSNCSTYNDNDVTHIGDARYNNQNECQDHYKKEGYGAGIYCSWQPGVAYGGTCSPLGSPCTY